MATPMDTVAIRFSGASTAVSTLAIATTPTMDHVARRHEVVSVGPMVVTAAAVAAR